MRVLSLVLSALDDADDFDLTRETRAHISSHPPQSPMRSSGECARFLCVCVCVLCTLNMSICRVAMCTSIYVASGDRASVPRCAPTSSLVVLQPTAHTSSSVARRCVSPSILFREKKKNSILSRTQYELMICSRGLDRASFSLTERDAEDQFHDAKSTNSSGSKFTPDDRSTTPVCLTLVVRIYGRSVKPSRNFSQTYLLYIQLLLRLTH